MSKLLPEDFHWVIARSQCSIPVVFSELQMGASSDAEKAQAVMSQNGWPQFTATNIIDNRFAVIRVPNPVVSSRVHFVHTENEIQVLDNDGKLFMTATL